MHPPAALQIVLTALDGDAETLRQRIARRAPGIGGVAVCAPELLREVTRSDEVDAVLLDCDDPESQADAVASAVRACPLVPVLVLSGAPESAASERLLRLGVQDYLVKRDTRGDQLLRAILHAIERKRLEIRLRTTLGELGQANARLRTLALKDPLTGALNRRAFYAVAGQTLARARRYGRQLALLYCDLDDFKTVNDRCGHGAGDVVLKTFGERCAALLRRGDTLGRLGGDEFAVLLDGVDDRAALTTAERVQGIFAEPLCVDGQAVAVSVSVGVAGFVPEHSLDELIAVADAAMYRAKTSGSGVACGRPDVEVSTR